MFLLIFKAIKTEFQFDLESFSLCLRAEESLSALCMLINQSTTTVCFVYFTGMDTER